MVNKRKKGQRIELLAKKQLEADGWIVQQAPPSTRWNKQVDLFGLFDLIAIRGGIIKFIQIKANKLPTKDKRKALCFFHDIWLDANVYYLTVEWWCYWNKGKRKKKQGWEIIRI